MGIIRRFWRTLTSCVTCKSIDEQILLFENVDPPMDTHSKVVKWMNDHSLWSDHEDETPEMDVDSDDQAIDVQGTKTPEVFSFLDLFITPSFIADQEKETPEMELPSIDQQSLGLNNDMNALLNEIISDVVQQSEPPAMEVYLSELFDEVIYNAIERQKAIDVEIALNAKIILSATILIFEIYMIILICSSIQ